VGHGSLLNPACADHRPSRGTHQAWLGARGDRLMGGSRKALSTLTRYEPNPILGSLLGYKPWPRHERTKPRGS
jgi:hypothetical protein